MAAAFVARKMGVPATIVIPSSTPKLVVQRLQDQDATVKIVGKVQLHYLTMKQKTRQGQICFRYRIRYILDTASQSTCSHIGESSLFFRFGTMPTLKLFGLLKLRVSLMFLRLIIPCFGRFFLTLQFFSFFAIR